MKHEIRLSVTCGRIALSCPCTDGPVDIRYRWTVPDLVAAFNSWHDAAGAWHRADGGPYALLPGDP